MDIDTMEAGRAMDHAIAEQVMGFVEIRGDLWKSNDGQYWYLGDPQARPRTPHNDFHPSTDIAAAWQVVEAVQARLGPDYYWQLVTLRNGSAGALIGHEYDPATRTKRVVNVVANTMPLAICRAALKAVQAAKEAQDA